MAEYGVTPFGFRRPSLRQLLDLIEGDQRAEISPTIDHSPEGPLGQINAIFARQLGIAWESQELVFGANDADKAEDFALTALAKLTGTYRHPATHSTVRCEVELDKDTQLVAGEHFAHVRGKPDIRFTPRESFTAPHDGIHILEFRAEQLGPIEVPYEQLSTIATAVVGWHSVLNIEDATPGRFAENDSALRRRREEQLAAQGSSTLDALRADLSKMIGVESVTMFENVSGMVDEKGLPPHSFEALIYDGSDPADNDDIANTIWRGKPSGIRPYGTSSGKARDPLGHEHTVSFSRVQERPVYLTYQLVKSPLAPPDSVIAEHVAKEANRIFRTAGADITALTLRHLPMDLEGVTDVPSLKLGFSSSPSGTSNLTLGIRELGRFDTSRIVFE